MKFAVIPNMTRENAGRVTEALLGEIESIGCEALLSEELKSNFNNSKATFLSEDDALMECDIVVSVGGDGTFINAAKRATAYKKPLLCVNAGKLAFLACLERNELELIKNVKDGNYSIEKRMLLDARIIDKTGKILYHSNCVNDAVVSRSGNIRIINLSIVCDGAPLIQYMADGVIIATPTGSTAYSLSAGGPVIEPQVESILITPVCCHTVFSRSVLLGASSVLEMVHDNSGEAILSCDGEPAVIVPDGAKVVVSRSPETAKFIKIKSDTFIDVLSKKIAN